MSFTPIKFTYTPPPTLAPQTVLNPTVNTPTTTAIPTSNQFGSAAAAASNAAALVMRLAALTETSQYLMSCLQALYPTLGVNLTPAANPDLNRALARIYSTTDPPTGITMAMYMSLLETDTSCMQFDLMNPPVSSTVQIQPLQRADIGLASKSFENALIASGVYNQTAPVLMRSLAGDQLIFSSWSNALQSYPILSNPQLTPSQVAATASPTTSSSRDLSGGSTDVSDDLTETMNGILDQWQSSYAGIYNVVASPDPTETALPSVVGALSTQPTSDLTRLVTMLQNLLATQHQPMLQQAHDSVDSLISPRLLSDVLSYASNLDYMTQVGVTPSLTLTSAMGSLMSVISSVNIGTILNVGITGTVAQSAGGYSPPPLTISQESSLEGLPEGLQILGANIAWSQQSSVDQTTFVSTSIQRLSLRRMQNQGSQTELLTSMKSISSSIGIIQSIIQSGANTPAAVGNTTSLSTTTATPAVGLTSFGTLVNSLQSQSGSSLSLDGNTLIITPPAIPTASATVQSTLAAGGVNQITTQTLQVPVSLTVTQ